MPKLLRIRFVIAGVAIACLASPIRAQRPTISLPQIVSNDVHGRQSPAPDGELSNSELQLRQLFACKDAPNEVIALASGESYQILMPELSQPVGMRAILIYGNEGELRSYCDDDANRYYHRRVSAAEVVRIREYLAKHNVDELAERTAQRLLPDGRVVTVVGAGQYSYLHLTADRGIRIRFSNPPIPEDDPEIPPDDPVWRYRKLVTFFEGLYDHDQRLDVAYEFARPIDGFEVLYAHPRSDVLSVWEQDGDLRVTTLKKWERDAVAQHRSLKNGKLGAEVPDPQRVVKIAMKANGVPLYPARVSVDRHNVAGDGRWVLGNHADNEELMCFDRQENKFISIKDNPTRLKSYPLYYLESHQRFLLGRFDPKDTVGANDAHHHRDWREVRLFDPAQGEAAELDTLPDVETLLIDGMSLWFQQLPRRLQAVRGHEHLVWAAIPEENSTKVGQYDTVKLRWVSYGWIPNLKFETKDLWVDEDEDKLYIVYKGHLLSVRSPL